MKEASIKQRFIELRSQGQSYVAIATELGVSRQTLQSWARDFQAEIHNLKAIRVDALRVKYRMLQEHQIEAFGKQLEKLLEEIAKRAFDEVPTHKLMELFLKYSGALNELHPKPKFLFDSDSLDALLVKRFDTLEMQ